MDYIVSASTTHPVIQVGHTAMSVVEKIMNITVTVFVGVKNNDTRGTSLIFSSAG